MDAARITGPQAGAMKYDLLTALAIAGLAAKPVEQTSVLRLTALITARYNWRLNEVSVGQRDLARMWSVNERTVKREMKRLTDAGLLICKRRGARGRVGAYTLGYEAISALSKPHWAKVGHDFCERMTKRWGDKPAVKVVRFSDYQPREDLPKSADCSWDLVVSDLATADRGLYQAWFSKLEFKAFAAGSLVLSAPSLFIQRYIETHLLMRIVACAETHLGPVNRVIFE